MATDRTSDNLSGFGCRARFVFLNDYPAFLLLVTLHDRKGLTGRFFKCLERRSSSDNWAARNWRIISAWPGLHAFSVPLSERSVDVYPRTVDSAHRPGRGLQTALSDKMVCDLLGYVA
jgi:hypothetical protein